MARTYGNGLGDRVKEEKMKRLLLDGYEKSLGKQHRDTKHCARSLAVLLAQELRDKEKTRALVKEYPHLMTATNSVPALLR